MNSTQENISPDGCEVVYDSSNQRARWLPLLDLCCLVVLMLALYAVAVDKSVVGFFGLGAGCFALFAWRGRIRGGLEPGVTVSAGWFWSVVARVALVVILAVVVTATHPDAVLLYGSAEVPASSYFSLMLISALPAAVIIEGGRAGFRWLSITFNHDRRPPAWKQVVNSAVALTGSAIVFTALDLPPTFIEAVQVATVVIVVIVAIFIPKRSVTT